MNRSIYIYVYDVCIYVYMHIERTDKQFDDFLGIIQ